MPNTCMICKQAKPLSMASYYRYHDSTLNELKGWVCGDCAKKEERTIARAYNMMARFKGQANELFMEVD